MHLSTFSILLDLTHVFVHVFVRVCMRVLIRPDYIKELDKKIFRQCIEDFALFPSAVIPNLVIPRFLCI